MTEQERIEGFEQAVVEAQERFGVMFQAKQHRSDVIRDGQPRVELWLEIDTVLNSQWKPPHEVPDSTSETTPE